jgi:hypothetical protein
MGARVKYCPRHLPMHRSATSAADALGRSGGRRSGRRQGEKFLTLRLARNRKWLYVVPTLRNEGRGLARRARHQAKREGKLI